MNIFLDYYIIDRKNGISYDPFLSLDKFLFAYSNKAIDANPFRINIERLIKGLAENRYRLRVKHTIS